MDRKPTADSRSGGLRPSPLRAERYAAAAIAERLERVIRHARTELRHLGPRRPRLPS
jgi:hypothetical protein